MHFIDQIKALKLVDLVPLAIAIFPPLQASLTSFIDPEPQFVYTYGFEPNPLAATKRLQEQMLEGIAAMSQKGKAVAKSITQSKEMKEAMSAMSNVLVPKPYDSTLVTVVNLSRHELRDIRVHFSGCIGFNSFQTTPDSIGSAANNALTSSVGQSNITVRYDRLQPNTGGAIAPTTTIRFFGENTASCIPSLEATLGYGKEAVGQPVIDLNKYMMERAVNANDRGRLLDIAVKTITSVFLIFLYLKIRSLGGQISYQTRFPDITK